MAKADNEQVHVEDYDPAWPARFAVERQRLVEVLQPYATLKDRLAEEHRLDRERYTDAKGPFIQRMLTIASATVNEK